MNPYYVEHTTDEKGISYYFVCRKEDFSIVVYPAKYLMHKTRIHRSPNTVRRIAFSISYYLTYLKEKMLTMQEVLELPYAEQFQHFTDFLIWIKEGRHTEERREGPDSYTCNTYLRDVFGLYQFWEMEENPEKKLQVLFDQEISYKDSIGVLRRCACKIFKGFLPEDENIGRTAEEESIQILLEHCTNLRDKLLLLLFAETGFRIGEVLGIRYTDDIDYERHRIRVHYREQNENRARAKNAEERWALISTDTFEVLTLYLAQYKDLLKRDTYLFVNLTGKGSGKPLCVNTVYAMLRRLEGKTGIKITPHMLRHFFANERWKNGWDLVLIAQALGHKQIATTEKYLNIESDSLIEATNQYFQKNQHLLSVRQLL